MVSKKNSYFILTLLLFAVLPSVCTAGLFIFLKKYESFLLTDRVLSMFIFSFASILTMGLAITPTTFIAIISGYFFGWQSLPLLIIAYSLAAVLGVKTGKALHKLGVKPDREKSKILNNLLERLDNDQFLFVFFTRLSPVLPFAMTNIALSNLSIKWRQYILGSLSGMLPRTLAFFYTGMNAGEIWSFAENPSLSGFYKLLPVALILISTMGLIKYLKPKAS